MSGTVFRERPDRLLEQSTGASAIVVDPHDGGRLVSLRIGGVEVLGGTAPVPGRPQQIFHGSFVMAPFVGRTAHGRFSFEGQDYRMPTNFGPHAMHGFGFDRPWRRDGEELALDLDERWPLGGSVHQRFELTETRLVVTATLRNEQRRMPGILGFHPWFASTLADGSTASYDFEPGIRYLCDDEGIPVSTIPGGGDRPWDDSFAEVAADPVVRWQNGLEITIARTGSHWIVCETMPDAFCVEPLSGPVNGLATGEAATVSPGHPLVHSLDLRWT